MPHPNRKQLRLKDWDYSSDGAYFITICTYNRECLFGEIVNDEMRINECGKIVEECWQDLLNHYPNCRLDSFVIMPNHLHGVVWVDNCGGKNVGKSLVGFLDGNINRTKTNRMTTRVIPTKIIDKNDHTMVVPAEDNRNKTISDIVGAFKSVTTNEYIRGVKNKQFKPFENHIWQRSFHDHIIRDEEELNRIRQYIRDNPRNWKEDENYL